MAFAKTVGQFIHTNIAPVSYKKNGRPIVTA